MAQHMYGVDFGTSNIKIYNGQSKSITNEKNIIAIKGKDEFFDFGDNAFEMYEKAPENISVSFPIKFGVIADIKNMRTLFEKFFIKINYPKVVRMGKFCMAVPSNVTEVEKRAFFDVIADSNVKAKDIKAVEKPIADAIGAGIDISTAKGNMIVNIGADTTEISVISMGGIVISKIVKTGGNKFDEAICNIVKKKYNMLIGLKTAEILKFKLANAIYDEDDENWDDEDADDTYEVYGRNIITGLPCSRPISAELIHEAINENLSSIVESIKILLERTPPELSADIIDTGIYLTGGSSEIKNLDILISKETELKVNTVRDPGESVIRGVSQIVTNPKLKDLMYTPRETFY
ncbi:MAG: rod shape-determining protein [Eubacterium sp.]